MAILGLFFVYFCLFHKQTITFLQPINLKKCPSSKRCWDSNPGPSEHESHPITTRPGLPPTTFKLYLVIAEQVWNFSGRQQVVDQDQKPFIGDLSVRHEEHRAEIFETRLLVQVCEVQLQVSTAVAFPQCDLTFKMLVLCALGKQIMLLFYLLCNVERLVLNIIKIFLKVSLKIFQTSKYLKISFVIRFENFR